LRSLAVIVCSNFDSTFTASSWNEVPRSTSNTRRAASNVGGRALNLRTLRLLGRLFVLGTTYSS
jgi:hypothetical protein